MNNGLLMPEFGLGTTMGFFQQLYVGRIIINLAVRVPEICY